MNSNETLATKILLWVEKFPAVPALFFEGLTIVFENNIIVDYSGKQQWV